MWSPPFGYGIFVYIATAGSISAKRSLTRALNSPSYLSNHVHLWENFSCPDDERKKILRFRINNDTETIERIETVRPSFTSGPWGSGASNSHISSGGLDDWSEQLLYKSIEFLKPVLEPVSVDYSNNILAEQIHGISILLFVMSVFIFVLIISLLWNILVLVYSEKLLNYFTNKYIRWYIIINRKLIGFEVICLGGSILYFMFNLIKGIQFIATHPIIIS